MDIKNFRKVLSTVKYIYTAVYIISFALFYNSFIHCFAYRPTQLLYVGLMAAGLIILAVDFFTSGILLKVKASWLLILFYIACLISVGLNIVFDPVGNLKLIACMMVQTFVLAAVDKDEDINRHKKFFRIIAEVYSFIWFVGAAIAVGMFVVSYNGALDDPDPLYSTIRIGFVEGRLFGVFSDPNYASICIMFSILMLLANSFFFKESRLLKVYHGILIAIDLLYIILAKSRTAEICLYAAMAVIGFMLMKGYIHKKKPEFKRLKRYAVSVLAAILSAAICFAAYTVGTFVMDELYVFVGSSLSEDADKEKLEEELIRPDVEYSSDITNNRSHIWADYLEVFKKEPVFGTGPRNGLSYARENLPELYISGRGYYYHNGYLAVLVGTGIVGAAIMLAYMGYNIYYILSYLVTRNRNQDELYKPIVFLSAILVIGAVGALPLMAVFFNISSYDSIFWFILGYVTTLIRISNKDDKEEIAFKLTSFLRIKGKKTQEEK